MKLSDFVIKKAVVPRLVSTKRDEAIEELINALIKAKAVDKTICGELLNMIIDREQKGSTGFGKGVAVPHVKHAKIKKMIAVIGVSQQGVDFNALDTAPVYSIVLLLSPEDQPDEHLQAMECIFSYLQQDTFRRFLRQSTDTEAVMELLHDADTQQL